MAAKSKYTSLDNSALVDAVKFRRAGGRQVKVDLRASDDLLRAALDNDDMENGEFNPNAPASPAPAPEGKAKADALKQAEKSAVAPVVLPASLRNQVAKQDNPVLAPTQPSDEEFAAGTLARHRGENMLFQVVKRPADDFNKPVKCRVPAQDSGHPGFYWEGSEVEFSEQFEKA